LAELVTLAAVVMEGQYWTEKEPTQAEVKTFILDRIFTQLPDPPYTEVEKLQVAGEVYRHIWQQSVSHGFQATPRSPSAAGGISAR